VHHPDLHITQADHAHGKSDPLRLGGPAQDLSNFQMAPIPILSVLTCSTSSPHDILKVSKKIDHNLPVGRSNVTSLIRGFFMGF